MNFSAFFLRVLEMNAPLEAKVALWEQAARGLPLDPHFPWAQQIADELATPIASAAVKPVFSFVSGDK